MKFYKQIWSLIPFALSLIFISSSPKQAHADFFSLWAKPKVDMVSGTGEIFKTFEGQPAAGIELGLELLGISLWGDIEWMNSSQYWASLNGGFDLSVGDTFEVTLGAYGGLIFFNFPNENGGSSSGINDSQKGRIENLLNSVPGMPVSYSDFEETYNDFFADEEKLSDTAVGLNGRLRLSLEYHLLPLLSLGVQGSLGYHVVITGEEAASGAKSSAIDAFVSTQPLPESAKAEVKTELKDILGAKEIDTDKLGGRNYSTGIFVNFRF